MPQLHVNSTTAGTPTSPYDTWAKAATTIGACVSVAVPGDEIFVHPSHVESAAASMTWTGTPANPVKIVCGTPGATSGITALQNTAQWGIAASGSNASWSGSVYVRGISFRNTGSTGTGSITLNATSGGVSTFEDCQFYYVGAGGGNFVLGSSTALPPGITSIINCSYRIGQTAHSIRLNGRVYIKGLTGLAGSTPTTLFLIANTTNDVVANVEADGLDLSVHANTFKLTSAFSKLGKCTFRNIKVPSGWGVLGSTNVLGAEVLTGAELEVLNYGDGDTNHRYWIENKQGRAISEDTIKRTDGSGNSTATYSRRLQTLSTVCYPNSIYRGPGITKYVAANGQYKGISVRVAHDGLAIFTNKEFWIEVSFRGTSGSSLATISSGCPAYLTAASVLPDSAVAWEGFTSGVTTGPNGTSTWYTRYAFEGGLAVMEDGWITVTPCFAVPDKTVFIDDDFLVTDEGPI